MTSRLFDLGDDLTVAVDQREGAGRPALVLHGGAGPRSVAGLTLPGDPTVLTPTHPGFDGQPRPAWFDTIGDLAVAYLDLLDVLDLDEVLVVGSSIGGWIAAEMAHRDTRGRIGGLVLLNAVGVDPARGELTDTRKLNPAQLGELAFVNPALRLDPSTLTEEQRAVGLANQQTLAVYAGEPFMYDPKLRHRLRRAQAPALVVWGEQDGIASVDYGRSYAEAFPQGRFVLAPGAGHFPHIEAAALTAAAIDEFQRGL
ncbi:alpha/beta fold hydrolase [Kutzneria buriramensis]|uniref:Pimeloyl-ACP methyl ester carboxylesterase n=1 Tax=Kutzneria buriramensis TaxID=1045776 RepID=A0A3E0I6K5_9PSEU|nr:alpha/beta hydrolase [Kutzneria buriramensis]REH54384.1 pimeloyl-ACP methyl ester carboxylesterase [Kutzneria buriramensis]